MSRLQHNTLANLFGRVWGKALGLVFIPLYIKFMGAEAFGLVGFYLTLQSVFGLLDAGIGAALVREMARLSAVEGSEPEQRDLLRTVEIIYWSLGLFLGVFILWLSPWIAHHWVNPRLLTVVTVERGVSLMGLAYLLQFPLGLYQGGLMGKERQVLLNIIQAAVATLQGLGAVLLLWLVSPTIECFFIWQIAISILATGATAFSLWRSLAGSTNRPRFRLSLLKRIWRFAAGWFGIGVAHTIVFNADRIVISKLLSLEFLGYYTLAQTIAMSLWAIVDSVTGAAIPRFSQLVVLGAEIKLKNTYHRTCQFLSVLLMPVAAVIALFSWEIVMLWTRNSVIADNIHQITSLLIIGIMLRGIASIPFCLQIAYGWLKLALFTNFLSAICFVPPMIFLANRFGALGVAAATTAQHCVFFLFMPIMHYCFLKGEQWHWLRMDLLQPLIVVVLIAGSGRLLYPSPMTPLTSLIYFATVWFLSTGAAAMVTPEVRVKLFNHLWLKAETRVS